MYTHLQYLLFFFFSSKYLKSLITEKTTNDMDKIMTGTTEISVFILSLLLLMLPPILHEKRKLKSFVFTPICSTRKILKWV